MDNCILLLWSRRTLRVEIAITESCGVLIKQKKLAINERSKLNLSDKFDSLN